MNPRSTRLAFPFPALVGQERLKRALLLNTISPEIGGVLIRGEKGTAKSTAVRGLASLVPAIEVVVGCPYSCDPHDTDLLCPACTAAVAAAEPLTSSRRQVSIVELPIGATEDRVLGTLNIERALQRGERHFEPGLLARANRGIVYIDEVNLLSHHLVDILLDAAVTGINHVEREGISFSHPARFVLIGTMNPEEGELRPQLLDRFGLAVDVTGTPDPEARMEVVKRRIAFEQDPAAFCRAWQAEEAAERARLQQARALLPTVMLSEELLRLIAQICLACGVDGMRADIVIYKTARALAASAGRTQVSEEDVRQAAEMALLHRLRRQPFDTPQTGMDTLHNVVQQHQSSPSSSYSPASSSSPPDTSSSTQGQADCEAPQKTQSAAEEPVFPVGDPFPVRPLRTPVSGRRIQHRPSVGTRSLSQTESGAGRYTGSRLPCRPLQRWEDVALDATLRTAAVQQHARSSQSPPGNAVGFILHPSDLREKIREAKARNLILFVLDASGSMGVEKRMIATKGAVLSLLRDAYQRRDTVGCISVRGQRAELVLSPTNSVEQAERYLRDLPTGGRTPLSHGLALAKQTIMQGGQHSSKVEPLLVLVSDGRANVAQHANQDPLAEAKMVAEEIHRLGTSSLVIDTETGFVRFGLAQEISAALAATLVKLEELTAEPLVQTVRQELARRGRC